MPKIKDIKKVLVIGSGPIVIGQAAEFDYAGVQALIQDVGFSNHLPVQLKSHLLKGITGNQGRHCAPSVTTKCPREENMLLKLLTCQVRKSALWGGCR